MGRVYLALHPGIGRYAAVKVLTSGGAADPEIVSRFITEARAANAIRHPNIVDIYDCGALDGGTPYIVMEFLEGETLTQALTHGPVDIDDALDWGCQIAEALAAAHACDVVHRDLKPDNLFLVHDAHRLGKRQVKVLDFGIAKLQHQHLEQAHKTRTGTLMGTPLYMSPEQCASQKSIDARTDIYSLGVILYEMVTGRRPFDGEGIYAIFSMHINDAPLAPGRLRADLPPIIEEIILKAMAKTPEQRQPSMAVFHSELELARGNASASSEALLRAQRLRPIPMEPNQPAGAHEIRTLGDAAVASHVAGRTTSAGRPNRYWPLLLAGAAFAIFAVYWAATGVSHRPAVPTPAPTPAPGVALPPPPEPAPPPPTPPPAPTSVEIGLSSAPPGASVYVGGLLVATTPGKYQAPAGNEPVEFTFRLPGYEPERIRALPAQGLTVTATFAATPQPRTASKRKRPGATETLPSADIQTER